jgi:hypothetical protein
VPNPAPVAALSAHKARRVEEFLAEHPRVHLHFTPAYSSWLNQVELCFSKIERDLIHRGLFTSTKDLARRSCSTSATTTTIQGRSSGEPRRAERVDQDVGGLEVAVDHEMPVGELHRVADPAEQLERHSLTDPAARDPASLVPARVPSGLPVRE